MGIRARFVGPRNTDGLPLEYHPGIPAADLDEATYDALDKEQKALVRSSSLYAMSDKSEKKAGDA